MAVDLILGGSGSIDDRGIVRRSLIFRCDTEPEAMAAGPASYLGLGKKPGGLTWEPTESGRFRATVVYEGVGDAEKDPEDPSNFEWVPRRSEEPIEAHPLIDRLMEVYGGNPDPETGKITFDRYLPTDAGPDGLPGNNGADASRRNPMFGRESYLMKTGIWRWTFFSREYPQKYEDSDGRIIQSVPGGRATPPEKNWMVLFEKASPVGSGESFGYDVQVDFILSEKGGWPPSQAIFADE